MVGAATTGCFVCGAPLGTSESSLYRHRKRPGSCHRCAAKAQHAAGAYTKRPRKTVCRAGHSLTEDSNVYVAKNGSRHCRKCNAQRAAEYKKRKSS